MSALEPALSRYGAAWVGWSGVVDHEPKAFSHGGLDLHPVHLDERHLDGFYRGFSNSTLWPLYHDAVFEPHFDKGWWEAYVAVNRRFAEVVAEASPPGAVVWVHDYHLQLLPEMLRALRSDVRIGFFLHIPFPAQELFMRIPWREQLVAGMLGADVVGFQTLVGAQNFRLVAERLLGRSNDGVFVSSGERHVLVDAFPVGIDVGSIRRLAALPSTIRRARQIREDLGFPRTVMLSVDRLDYTKGIPSRLRAYRELLREARIDAKSTVMVQIAQPSRTDVPGYVDVRNEIEQLVGSINGEFGGLDRVAVKYLRQSQSWDEVVALYLAADVMLVTPYRDGMNLVAKEYVASRLDHTGTLILSEFAGAAHELSDATLVNPYDIEAMKSVIERVVKYPRAGTREAMVRLSKVVAENDANLWATRFIDCLVI